jgi:hypothetical protein
METLTLPVQKKTIIKVDYSDLDRFINKFFNIPRECMFEFAVNQEASKDTSYDFSIRPETPDIEEVSKWIAAGFKMKYPPSAREILQYLALGGHIEYGEYIVKVSW